MRYVFLIFFLLNTINGYSQRLKLKKRASAALSGSEFSKSIRDSSLSLDEREIIIYNEIRWGNIPRFYRRLVQNKVWIDGKRSTIQRVLGSETLYPFLSDEGVIEKPYYPTEL